MLTQLFENLLATVRAFPTICSSITIVILILTISSWTHSTYIETRPPKHLRRIGLLRESNLADQYDPKYSVPEQTDLGQSIRIKALYIHPIKSCGAVELSRARLTKTGFLYDRCFAFAIQEDKNSLERQTEWRFISQRTKPQMSQIRTEIWVPHATSDPNDALVQAGGCVLVTFPDPDPAVPPGFPEKILKISSLPRAQIVRFLVPLSPTPAQALEYGLTPKAFTIHDRETSGLDMGKFASVATALPKLKKFLRIPERQGFTLLRCTPDSLTRTTKNLAPLKYIGAPAVHGYTDQQPVHINSISSVHAVSKKLPPENRPLNALRFRANIYITGAPAYAEEEWKRYRILPKSHSADLRANVAPTLSVVCRTSRCTMPNVNPDKGTFDQDTPAPGKKKGRAQPSTTLVEYRTVESGNKAALGYLGMHCVPENLSFEEAAEQDRDIYVEVGDEIKVLEKGNHLYGSTGNDY